MAKERPILFSGAMVRAIQTGSKTQTRRMVKPQPTRSLPHTEPFPGGDASWTIHHPLGWRWRTGFTADEGGGVPELLRNYCPYGVAGDKLWVRESFCENYFGDAQTWTQKHAYMAEWDRAAADLVPQPRWTPSIHMPRACSRITLEVTGVRVERLQDITEVDAKAEGVTLGAPCVSAKPGTEHIREFYALWETINGERPGCSWAENPWVWVVEFKRVMP